MSALRAERPVGPRFDLRAQRGEARLHARGPTPLALGSLRALELVAGDIGSTLDLRHGAVALRNRRTHAVSVLVSLDVVAVEHALRALGVAADLHCGPGAGAFGLTLSTGSGPVDCEVRARVIDDALVLRLTRFASLLPRADLAEVVREALRPVEAATWSSVRPLRVTRVSEGRALRVTSPHIVEALLTASFATGGWRLPRTGGLSGHVAWSSAGHGHGAVLTLAATLDPDGFDDREPVEPEAERPHDAARVALGQLLAGAPYDALDADRAAAQLETYLAAEPSPVMRADAVVTLAELLRSSELTGPVSRAEQDALVRGLGVRALALAGRSPDIARRVLALAEQSASPSDESLLAAVLAAPLPAAQQAALVLTAVPQLARTAPARARAWLERVRPFAPDLSVLRAAEAALLATERPPSERPESLARSHERAAEALAGEGHAARAAEAFAGAARAYQQARDAQAAARCWVACVSSVPGHTLALEWVAPGAAALQLAGRTQDAIALLATLLVRDVDADDRDALGAALDAAQRFHQGLPATLAAPELFAARRREL